MTQRDITTITEIIQSTQSALSDQLASFAEKIDSFQQEMREEMSSFKQDVHEEIHTFKSLVDMRFYRIESNMVTKQDLENYATKDDFNQLKVTLDHIVSILDDDHIENTAMSVQVTRHDKWIRRAATATGVVYTPGH